MPAGHGLMDIIVYFDILHRKQLTSQGLDAIFSTEDNNCIDQKEVNYCDLFLYASSFELCTGTDAWLFLIFYKQDQVFLDSCSTYMYICLLSNSNSGYNFATAHGIYSEHINLRSKC